MKNSDFQKGWMTMVASDLDDRQNLFVEIYCDGRFIAIVSQEKGLGKFDLEFPDPKNVDQMGDNSVRIVDLVEFQEAVEESKRRLLGKVP